MIKIYVFFLEKYEAKVLKKVELIYMWRRPKKICELNMILKLNMNVFKKNEGKKKL